MIEPEDIDISTELNQLRSRMADKGLKITNQRFSIAEWIFKVHEHFTVDDILESFKKKGEKVSPATVYRVLQMLLDLGMVTEHHFGKEYKYYEHVTGHKDHDHIICDDCGRIVEFTDDQLNDNRSRVSQSNGFSYKGHNLQIYGNCTELEQTGSCSYKQKKAALK